jgi:hypothetical protein
VNTSPDEVFPPTPEVSGTSCSPLSSRSATWSRRWATNTATTAAVRLCWCRSLAESNRGRLACRGELRGWRRQFYSTAGSLGEPCSMSPWRRVLSRFLAGLSAVALNACAKYRGDRAKPRDTRSNQGRGRPPHQHQRRLRPSRLNAISGVNKNRFPFQARCASPTPDVATTRFCAALWKHPNRSLSPARRHRRRINLDRCGLPLETEPWSRDELAVISVKQGQRLTRQQNQITRLASS